MKDAYCQRSVFLRRSLLKGIEGRGVARMKIFSKMTIRAPTTVLFIALTWGVMEVAS